MIQKKRSTSKISNSIEIRLARAQEPHRCEQLQNSAFGVPVVPGGLPSRNQYSPMNRVKSESHLSHLLRMYNLKFVICHFSPSSTVQPSRRTSNHIRATHISGGGVHFFRWGGLMAPSPRTRAIRAHQAGEYCLVPRVGSSKTGGRCGPLPWGTSRGVRAATPRHAHPSRGGCSRRP